MQIAFADIPRTCDEVDSKDADLICIMKLKGGKAIVKSLPDFAVIDCCQDGCDDFASVRMLVLCDNGIDMVTDVCEECYHNLTSEEQIEVAIFVVN